MKKNVNLKNFSGVLPLFPLPNVVHFPNTMLPLHIFEKRYRKLLEDALKGEKMIGMATLKPGWEEKYQGNPDIYSVACLGSIVEHEPLKDGRSNILLLGVKRVKIKNIVKPRPYRSAEVEILEDKKDSLSPEETKKLQNHLFNLYGETVIEYAGTGIEYPTLSTMKLKIGDLTDILSACLGLPIEDMIYLLGEVHVGKRAEFLIQRMERMLKKGGPKIIPSEPTSDFPNVRLN